MSSGFSGGAPDFYTAGGITGRSTSMNNPQAPYRSPLAGILNDPASQIVQRRPDFVGKRSLAEFQNLQQQHFFQQQQQALGLYLRNVRQRTYQQHSSPISPLSPVDFSVSISPESNLTQISSSASSPAISTRHGLPILQQARQQPINLCNGNGIIPSSNPNFSSVSYPNLVQNRVVSNEPSGQESEKKMMNRLQELEKQLLDDNDDEGDAVSVITNSEWSETIQSLISSSQKSISLSPTSSSSSCSSSSASPPTICSKQSLLEAASAISEGKPEVATEILTRLNQVSNAKGTSEQRWTAYMASALRSRVNPTEHPPPVAELYCKEHMVSTQMLYEKSPCFKLGFVAANLAILEATSDQQLNKLHVVDFDIGQGCQYVHLIHALAARKVDRSASVKITTFADFTNGIEERLKAVGDWLKTKAKEVGVSLNYSVLSLKICDLSLETLGVESDEALAVNLAFRLYNLPDESVTTENLRDELLRRVKGLSPNVVTVVEQEMNANTAPFVARVTEACEYYGALFDSLDATMLKDNPERVRIEEGLSRKAANSVACEGRDRVERCEVFGKWRARMGMAGFAPKPLSQQVADSLLLKLNSGTRANPGFTVKEETGRICFGWMGRTLTVAG
uniref:Putative scarecrow-like protein 8 n=1 Tax=Davidia involucrata TaxID=16924 RepID=A0A5B7APY1_DAVIN